MKNFDSFNELNVKKIIKVIREKGPISRIDISEQLNISQPSVTRIVEELIKEKLIEEIGLGSSTGGRRPILLSFNPTCYYSVGVELSRSIVKVALSDLNGNIISIHQNKTTKSEKISNIVDFVKQALIKILEKTSVDRSKIIGAGVGLPGPFNETEDGRISPPGFYGEKDIPLKSMLQEALGLPIVIERNSYLAVLAEKWFGKGVSFNHIFFVMAGMGIGSGIIIDGKLYRGAYGEVSGLGHTTIDLFGDQCSCGNYGCLETLVSIPKVIENVKKELKIGPKSELDFYPDDLEALTIEDIGTASRRGSAIAKNELEKAGRYLGVGIANMINLFPPEVVILGGELGTADPIILDSIKSVLSTRVLNRNWNKMVVMTTNFKEDVVLGAAALVIEDLFSLFW